MTLYRLLMLTLVLLVGILTTTNLWLFLRGSQELLNHQLSHHALDTATSLGLSLTPVLADEDWVLAQSMVDSIFDNGDLQLVRLESLDGSRSIVRSSRVDIEGVPAWFTAMLPLESPSMISQVNAQWRLVAEVEVQANVVAGYQYLWDISRVAMLTSAVLAAVALLGGGLVLNHLLKPLKLAEEQARGLRRHQYIRQKHLPRVRELNSLVSTMNQMVDTSEAMFKQQVRRMDRLRAQTLLDEETGLGNLSRARQRLEQQLSDREMDGGMLAKLHLVGLDKVEVKGGVEAEHSLLKTLAGILREVTLRVPNARVYRTGYADFQLMFPGAGPAELAQVEGEIRQRLGVNLMQAGGDRVLMVATPYRLDEKVDQLESSLDQLMADALASNERSLFLVDSGDHTEVPERAEQEAQMARILANAPKLLLQTAQDGKGVPLAHEILTRFYDGERWLSPGPVMALVAQQQNHQQLDIAVLQAVVARLEAQPELNALTYNLTPESVLDPVFLGKLRQAVSGYWDRIGFEVPERACLMDTEQTQRFVRALGDAGARVWLDHATPSGMMMVTKPGLYGIKLDPGYTQALMGDPSQVDLVELMITAAHSRGIKVVAQQVEDAELAQRLWQLGIDGVQGFAVAPPRPMGEQDEPL
ncbi:bifunctional diguanylate cyclase/phosphodiesterase [Ferrimonas marina]|uniref:EAL domain, c-di-GMP-specific phosphodiesterase class I (Or its enzymatically inactive variant) n=1 Tax=Ferrimonas marina TaxID=299255 RepID=A0A1M5XXQ3_9GAMM|nr:LapD/MoxY N-terminal periplasmic domain-containing protein [Ferrimonas marina]SHI04560.1 EAL domain, c-di-GMP-specific phosphodiesterase class I (or its enzymatically inactive variant) [Ferrimonas marina]